LWTIVSPCLHHPHDARHLRLLPRAHHLHGDGAVAVHGPRAHAVPSFFRARDWFTVDGRLVVAAQVACENVEFGNQEITWVKGQGQNQNQVAFKLWVNWIRNLRAPASSTCEVPRTAAAQVAHVKANFETGFLT
jgi:hypothetical protein